MNDQFYLSVVEITVYHLVMFGIFTDILLVERREKKEEEKFVFANSTTNLDGSLMTKKNLITLI